MSPQRQPIPVATKIQVLTEAGYRCAVPTCRTILAIDLHHIVEVRDGGANEPANLLALCPTCHALFHRGTIARESIAAWKGMLIALSSAFDISAIDDLLFLNMLKPGELNVSGDGVLKFSRLVAAGFAQFALAMQNGPIVLYEISLTQKGRTLISAWKKGDRTELERAIVPAEVDLNDTSFDFVVNPLT